MAKYTITHRCGHEHAYQLVGKNSERDRKQDWLMDQLCPVCRREADQVEKAKQNAAAAEANLAIGATPLSGTEAQVGYAEAIRAQALAIAGTAIVKSSGEAAAFFEQATRWLMDQAEAAWWIESYKTIKPNQPEIFAILAWVQDRKAPPPDAIDVARHFFLQAPMLTAALAAQLGLGEAYAAMLTARARVAAKAELRAEVARTRPARPAVLQALAEKHGEAYNWNRKVYSGGRIYICNQEVRLTPDQVKEVTAYETALTSWCAKKKESESI